MPRIDALKRQRSTSPSSNVGKGSFRYNRTQPATVTYDPDVEEVGCGAVEQKRKISAEDAEAQRSDTNHITELLELFQIPTYV